MPDNPTDKKLSFVEWYANLAGCSKKLVKRYIENMTTNVRHNENCMGGGGPCGLCDLQAELSEYREYFKQNK